MDDQMGDLGVGEENSRWKWTKILYLSDQKGDLGKREEN